MAWKIFRTSIIISVIALIVSFFYGGWAAVATVALLGIMEISLSADNAVVSARIVKKLSKKWQTIFLTIGIFVAVFVVRFGAPILIVSAVTGLSASDALALAMEKGPADQPGSYAYIMHHEHPAIAAFGGLFLLLIALNFLFEEKEHYWLSWVEKPLAKIGNIDNAAIMVALGVLTAIAAVTQDLKVVICGLAGILTHMLVSALGSYFENREEEAAEHDEEEASHRSPKDAIIGLTGKAAFFSFLYLEVLDASFSLDGVVAAFAVTSDPILIALGLGFIGALFVRSTTIYLVRKGTLDDLIYLDHGAHWAIGSLAALLFVSMVTPIPELVTGTLSVLILIAALITSVKRNKRLIAEGHEDEIEVKDHVEGLGKRHVELDLPVHNHPESSTAVEDKA
ncbi:MAG: DUF475 domain-containing protein [Enterococcus sp.]|nr:DUF475 domain-containing protein [Enterococcus sp.]